MSQQHVTLYRTHTNLHSPIPLIKWYSSVKVEAVFEVAWIRPRGLAHFRTNLILKHLLDAVASVASTHASSLNLLLRFCQLPRGSIVKTASNGEAIGFHRTNGGWGRFWFVWTRCLIIGSLLLVVIRRGGWKVRRRYVVVVTFATARRCRDGFWNAWNCKSKMHLATWKIHDQDELERQGYTLGQCWTWN